MQTETSRIRSTETENQGLADTQATLAAREQRSARNDPKRHVVSGDMQLTMTVTMTMTMTIIHSEKVNQH